MPRGGTPLVVPALAAVCALLAPAAGLAQGLVVRLPGLGPTSLTATSTTIVRFRGSNFDRNVHDDEFFSLTERLDHIWSTTHADYRGYAGERWPECDRGARTITVCGGAEGTVLKLLDDPYELIQANAARALGLRHGRCRSRHR